MQQVYGLGASLLKRCAEKDTNFNSPPSETIELTNTLVQ